MWESAECFESAVSRDVLALRAKVWPTGGVGWRVVVEDLDSGMSSVGQSVSYGWLGVTGDLRWLAVGLRGERVRLLPAAFGSIQQGVALDVRGAHTVVRDGNRVLVAAGGADAEELCEQPGRSTAWRMLRPGAGNDVLADHYLQRFDCEVFRNAPQQCALAVEDLERWIAEGRGVQVFSDHPCLARLRLEAEHDAPGWERESSGWANFDTPSLP